MSSTTRSFRIDRDSKTPLTQQIVVYFGQAIRDGVLLFGTKMSSIRDLAEQLEVNKICVISAYEKLTDENLIVSRPGSGFFVAYRPRRPQNSSPVAKKTSVPTHLDGVLERLPRLIPGVLSSSTDLVPLGGSHAPVDLVPLDDLRSAARHVLHDFSSMNLSYENPQGHLGLRQRIVAELEHRGVPVAGPEQILITGGALQALNLCLEALTNPGDSVVAEVPSFSLLFPLLAQRGLKLIPLTRSFDGFNMTADFEHEVKREKTRVFIISPNFHNPTGGILSPHERHEILRMANQCDATVVEMDVYQGLSFGDFVQAPIAALDGLVRCLHVSSFSKILAPGLRVGFVAGPADVVQKMLRRKLVTEISSSSLDQAMVCELMARGVLRKQVAKTRELFRSRRDTLISMLKKLSPSGSQWTQPEGGLFLWFEFPPGAPAAEIEKTVTERRILIAPGSMFYPNEPESRNMRLNFSALEPVQTYRALETVFAIWRAASSKHWGSARQDTL